MVPGAPGRRRLAALVAVTVSLVASSAFGEEDLGDARKAYDRGAKAYDAGDYATAAREAAYADQLVPNDVALELALKAALKIDDPVLAMVLADRAEARKDAGEATKTLAERARKGAAERVGELRVDCKGARTCTATVDGAPFPFLARSWATVGPHAVRVVADGRAETFEVVVARGREALVAVRDRPASAAPLAPSVAPSAPASPSSPDRAETAGGLSPAWFWAGVAVTAALGAATVASGVDTLNQHDDFVAQPSRDASTNGQSAQTRTNVLLGVTGGAAAVTLALGLFAVKF